MGSFKVVFSLTLVLLVLTPTCLANLWGLQDPLLLGLTGQLQPRRLRRGQQVQNRCNIQQLNANEPDIRVQAEAGVTEIWNSDDPEFQCAGVTVVRQIVEPGGLVLPFYVNSASLTYVDGGEGIAGVSIPGCPETFETGFSDTQDRDFDSRRDQRQQSRGSDRDADRHHQDRGSDRRHEDRGFDQAGDRRHDDRRGGDQRHGERSEDRRGDQRHGDRSEDRRGDQSHGNRSEDRRGDQSHGDRSEDRRGDQRHGDRSEDRRGDQRHGDRSEDRRGDQSHDDRREDRRGDQRHGERGEDRRRGDQQHGEKGPGRRGVDRHQKVRRLRNGDIFALPAGFSTWFHNDGQNRLTLVTLFDNNNFQNQLDQNLRTFLLAGNLEQSSQGDQGRQRSIMKRRGDENVGGNVFRRFNRNILAEIFGVDEETINQIQGQNDNRGNIVWVQGDLSYLIPDSYDEEQEFSQDRGQHQDQGRQNGLEETLCSARLRENIDEPRIADVYNPQGGRFTSLNSHKLPILNFLQLSANRVRLYPNAILAPHWKINAHTIAYFTGGSGQVQVVDDQGNLVFDEEVQQGQLLVIPQNFVVLKQANQDGLEWVEFLTNDQAMISPLAGRTSIFRGLPEEVIANAYGVSREDARRLKYNREELTVLSPSFGSSQRGRGDRDPFSIV